MSRTTFVSYKTCIRSLDEYLSDSSTLGGRNYCFREVSCQWRVRGLSRTCTIACKSPLEFWSACNRSLERWENLQQSEENLVFSGFKCSVLTKNKVEGCLQSHTRIVILKRFMLNHWKTQRRGRFRDTSSSSWTVWEIVKSTVSLPPQELGWKTRGCTLELVGSSGN